MAEKDLTAVGVEETPRLTFDDPSAQRAADAFSPEALAVEAQLLAEQQRAAAGGAGTVQGANGSGSGAGGKGDQRAQTQRRERPRAKKTVVEASPTGDLVKKTGYPSEGGRQFLNQFRRRQHLAKTLVAEYAVEQLFAAVDDDAIVAALRDHRKHREASLRRPLTIQVGGSAQKRIEHLKDDCEIPEGAVIGYAIDWLATNQNEETIVTALRARGYGYYRAPRVPA